MSPSASPHHGKTLALNKRARFDYTFIETYEAGLVLTGAEAKSAQDGQVQLQGAFVSLTPKGAVLKHAYIAAYKPANQGDAYDPNRTRSLLLHKRELRRLIGKTGEAGLTIIPVRLYVSGRRVKVELALAKGKKAFEKKDAIKKRELDREVRTRMYTAA